VLAGRDKTDEPTMCDPASFAATTAVSSPGSANVEVLPDCKIHTAPVCTA
jgi:hypothetical protein